MIIAFCVSVAVGASISFKKMSLNRSCDATVHDREDCQRAISAPARHGPASGSRAYLDLALERRLEVAEQHQKDGQRQLKQRRCA